MRSSVPLAKLALVLASFALSLGALEVLLREHPFLLGQEFVNGLRSLYTTDVEGIYGIGQDCEGHEIRLMKPGFETNMYYNGYTWLHSTDRNGFRNAQERDRVDIVLLGDSFVYGHGLEGDETVGVQLESLTGLSVGNLARQGDYAVPQAFLLSQHLRRLDAKFVFYVFYQNDIQDAYLLLDEAQMRQYIASPVNRLENCDRVEMAPSVTPHTSPTSTSLYIVEAHKWLRFRYFVRKRLRRIDGYLENGESLGWQVTKSAILRMKYESEKLGARLFVVPVTPTTDVPEVLLSRFTTDNGIGFIGTPTITSSDESLFLPGDGHFSSRGAYELARVIAEAVHQSENVEAGR